MSHIRCGWVPPTPLQRIRALLTAHPEASASILAGVKPAPTSDLLAYTCELNQLNLGACTAHGIAQMLYVAMMANPTQANVAAFVLARLWLYYMERALEGTVSTDAGANIGDGLRILAAKGVPNESFYPYDISKFTQDPGPAVDMAAFDSHGSLTVNYHPISSTGAQLITDVEAALTNKQAVVFGCTVTEQFCSTQPSGTIHTPALGSQVAGGHAEAVIGHDRANQRFKIKNSWGGDWGDPTAGPDCWWCGYDYFADPAWGASDAWIVSALPGGLGH